MQNELRMHHWKSVVSDVCLPGKIARPPDVKLHLAFVSRQHSSFMAIIHSLEGNWPFTGWWWLCNGRAGNACPFYKWNHTHVYGGGQIGILKESIEEALFWPWSVAFLQLFLFLPRSMNSVLFFLDDLLYYPMHSNLNSNSPVYYFRMPMNSQQLQWLQSL